MARIFRDANFSRADLRGISMRGTRLAHAKFDKANLTRLTLTDGTPILSDLTDADITVEQLLNAVLDEEMLAPAAAAD
jgi:uncharacterized protein YjbI with pentapeptide repeats